MEEREQTYNDIIDVYKKAGSIFRDREYYNDDIEKILSENKIYDDNEMYWVYYDVGSEFAEVRRTNYGPISLLDLGSLNISNKFATLQENLEERDLINDYTKIVDINNWKIIEKQDIESKIKAIDVNLKID